MELGVAHVQMLLLEYMSPFVCTAIYHLGRKTFLNFLCPIKLGASTLVSATQAFLAVCFQVSSPLCDILGFATSCGLSNGHWMPFWRHQTVRCKHLKIKLWQWRIHHIFIDDFPIDISILVEVWPIPEDPDPGQKASEKFTALPGAAHVFKFDTPGSRRCPSPDPASVWDEEVRSCWLLPWIPVVDVEASCRIRWDRNLYMRSHILSTYKKSSGVRVSRCCGDSRFCCIGHRHGSTNQKVFWFDT